MKYILFYPSFYAHLLNALFLLIAFYIFYINYSKIRNLEPFKLIILSLLFSIGIGIHGLSHLGLEKLYRYNPLSL